MPLERLHPRGARAWTRASGCAACRTPLLLVKLPFAEVSCESMSVGNIMSYLQSYLGATKELLLPFLILSLTV